MDVFISYRRDGGYALARLLYECLKKENISTFLDLEELRSGPFNEKLYNAIENAENFLLILPQHALDRCVNDDDWLRLEVEHALKFKKNIIPIMADDFTFPTQLPQSMQVLPYFNGVQVSREYFDASMSKIVSMLKGLEEREKGTPQHGKREEVRYYYSEDELEKHRLKAEDLVISKYEDHIIRKLLAGKEDVVCLDVNVLSPDGAYQLINYPAISKVIALTYNDDVEKEGKEGRQGRNVFFKKVQFESDDFEDELERCLSGCDADGIDFVVLNLAILDFKKPFKVLQSIRSLMNDDATMIICDVDDGAVFAYPDKDEYFSKFQSYYIHDKYSGYRYTGRQIYPYLKKLDARDIRLEQYGINTSDMTRKEKKALFETWFSFIPNDFKRMLREEPNSEIAKEVIAFCDEYYDDIDEQFFSSDTIFSAGYVIYSARF